MTTIGILQCGDPPEALRAAHGSYGGMVRRLLGPAGRDATVFDAARGELPAGPAACAAYVLTGSPVGVYDDLPWIAPLLGFLRAARGRARLVGLCFGHQAMAEAFGGRVVKSPKGWGIGVQPYAVAHRTPWMDGDDAAVEIRAAACHQDQVVAAPRGARVLAANAFTPLAALDYGDAVSFQFHPEFTPAFGRALVEARRDLFGAALADPAAASYDGPPDDHARVGRWIGRFLGAPPPP